MPETAFTVRAAEPVTALTVAVTFALPWPTPFANPFVFTVATDAMLEFQVKFTPEMTFPFASFAVAVNCCVAPIAMIADAGATITVATGPVVTTFEEEPPPQPNRKRRNAIGTNRPGAVVAE